MKNAVIYARDSGGNAQDQSCDRQVREGQKYCQEKGYIVTRIYRDEAKTGRNMAGREQINQLLADVKPGPEQSGIDVVVTWLRSRLARHVEHAPYISNSIRISGTELVFYGEDIIEDEYMSGVHEAFIDAHNAKFSADLSASVKRGMVDMVDQGAFYGKAPAGYMVVREPHSIKRDGTQRYVQLLKPNPDTWARARLAWELRMQGASYKEIHRQTHLFGGMSSYSTFFSNRIYTGHYTYGKKEYPEFCKPLITHAEFEQVQAVMRKRKHRGPRRNGSNYMLSGLITCGQCGSTMQVELSGKKHGSYTCPKLKKFGRATCDSHRISTNKLHLAVLGWLEDILFTPEHIAELVRHHIATTADSNTQRQQQIALLRHDLKANRTGQANLYKLIEKSATGIPVALENRFTELSQQEADLSQQLQALEAEPDQSAIQDITPGDIDAIATRLRASFGQQQDPKLMRELLSKILIEAVWEKKKRLRVQYTLPLSLMDGEVAHLWTVPVRGYIM